MMYRTVSALPHLIPRLCWVAFAPGDNGAQLNKVKTVPFQRVKEMNSKMREREREGA
jgi:hypothetical protein